jgi:hypothetical protein
VTRRSSVPVVAVDVEPLSEARWGRIEDALFARVDREERATLTPLGPEMSERSRARSWHRRVPLIGALVLAGAAAMAGVFLRSPGGTLSASRITTGAAESHVAIGEAALDVGPESTLRVSGDDDRGVLVELDHGDVEFEVAPRKHRPPFVVEAGDVRVRVVGTRFRVHRSPGVRVDVAHGVVEVTSHGETVRVGAGETWPARPSVPAVPEAIADAAEVSPEPTMELDDELDDGTVTLPPLRPSMRSPHGARHRATHGKTRLHAAATDVAASTLPSSAPVVAASPPAPPVAATLPDAPLPAPTLQQRYESAARIERARPEAALEVYRDLSRGDGAWASNALFAAARLQSERGVNADASRLLGEYLRRFPTGPNAADARVLLGRLR